MLSGIERFDMYDQMGWKAAGACLAMFLEIAVVPVMIGLVVAAILVR